MIHSSEALDNAIKTVMPMVRQVNATLPKQLSIISEHYFVNYFGKEDTLTSDQREAYNIIKAALDELIKTGWIEFGDIDEKS